MLLEYNTAQQAEKVGIFARANEQCSRIKTCEVFKKYIPKKGTIPFFLFIHLHSATRSHWDICQKKAHWKVCSCSGVCAMILINHARRGFRHKEIAESARKRSRMHGALNCILLRKRGRAVIIPAGATRHGKLFTRAWWVFGGVPVWIARCATDTLASLFSCTTQYPLHSKQTIYASCVLYWANHVNYWNRNQYRNLYSNVRHVVAIVLLIAINFTLMAWLCAGVAEGLLAISTCRDDNWSNEHQTLQVLHGLESMHSSKKSPTVKPTDLPSITPISIHNFDHLETGTAQMSLQFELVSLLLSCRFYVHRFRRYIRKQGPRRVPLLRINGDIQRRRHMTRMRGRCLRLLFGGSRMCGLLHGLCHQQSCLSCETRASSLEEPCPYWDQKYPFLRTRPSHTRWIPSSRGYRE